MEIERKWLVEGFPTGMQLVEEFEMAQGYISTRPTVRLRKEALQGGVTEYILCFKSGKGLVREEIELPLAQNVFEDLAHKILVKPLIPKLRRSYQLEEGLLLEVNRVDKGEPTEFFYAEIEFKTEAQALAFVPSGALAEYLTREVTNEPGQTMAEYWAATRENSGN